MTFEQRKSLILAAWVAVVATAGFLITIDRPSLWLFVASAALIPPTVATWLWNAPQAALAPVIIKRRR